MAGPKYEVEEYTDPRGVAPFGEWLLGLKDKRAQARILARIRRASFGNFGDSKPIAGMPGLYEMREHFGPGYRMYYGIVGRRLILLLAGSDKKRQTRAIADATRNLRDYHTRNP